MVYGIIKLINFAHGDIYMLGAYFGFFATTQLGLPFIPAIIFSMAGAAIAGIIIERVAYRPMRNAPRIAILITAIGVSFFRIEVCRAINRKGKSVVNITIIIGIICCKYSDVLCCSFAWFIPLVF